MGNPASETEQPEREFLSFDGEFTDRCADAFYLELFVIIPGAEEMFRDTHHQRQMFATMLGLIMEQHKHSDLLKITLRELGAKHRDMGVLSIHLKVGRAAFMKAITTAQADVTSQELQFFETAFDEIVIGMTAD